MKSFRTIVAIAITCFVFFSLGTRDSLAQFEVSWHTLDGGGGFSSAASFELAGTIGQHDAGQKMTGGGFELTGGYWAGFSDIDSVLGDVNGDGVVNLLDVAPFVDAISTGTFIPEADINGDGFVNLLDVQPFVDLLSS